MVNGGSLKWILEVKQIADLFRKPISSRIIKLHLKGVSRYLSALMWYLSCQTRLMKDATSHVFLQFQPMDNDPFDVLLTKEQHIQKNIRNTRETMFCV